MEETLIPIYRVTLVRERGQHVDIKCITCPEDAAKIFQQYLNDPDREVFAVLVLSVRMEVIGMLTVSIGTIESTLVHPREVFKPALLLNAHSLIVAHNHPSGDTTPSPEDRAVSHRLVEAGKLLGIEVTDHLIIAQDSFTSLKMAGLL